MILARYVVRQFFKPFFFGVAVFSLIIFLANLFDHLRVLMQSDTSFYWIFQYLWLEVPLWVMKVLPVATLLATLFTIGGFIVSGEWLALQASGFKPLDFLKPLFACALAVTALSFAVQELVVPYCYNRSRTIYQEKIKKVPPSRRTQWSNVLLSGGPGDILMAQFFDAEKGLMKRVVLDSYEDNFLTEQVDALEASWDTGTRRWVFSRGVLRKFDPETGKVREKPFEEYPSALTLAPSQLKPQEKKVDEMTLNEIRKTLSRLKRLELSTREAWVALHVKLAYPFANVIVCALGIPFALKTKKHSRSYNFAAALAISFLYWWVLSVGQALGNEGYLPAGLGAWLANILFAAASLALLRKSSVL